MVKLVPDYRSLPTAQAAATEHTRSRVLKRKRPNTKVACNSCRKRKWACNGDRPQCLSCRKNGVDCVYTSIHKSETHIGVLKRENEVLRQRSENLEELLDLLKSAPTDLAEMALLKLRYDNPASVLHLLRGVSPKSHLFEQMTARAYLPDIQSDLEFELMAQYPVAYPIPHSQVSFALSRRQSSFSNLLSGASPTQEPTTEKMTALTDDDPTRAELLDIQASPPPPPQYFDLRLRGLDIMFWTNVTTSNELAAGAISRYLETDHPFLGLFDSDLFLDSLVSHNSKFCSSLLVNSLLGYACQGYNTENSLALNKSYEFEREARKIYTVAKPSDSLPNLAGTVLLWLSHLCHGSGKDGLPCVDAGIQMAKRMRLFGVSDRLTVNDLGSTNWSAVAHTAWGCFNVSMIQTVYARPVATNYPPLVPIPGCIEIEPSLEDAAAEKLKIKFSGPGDTFQSWCKFWKTVSGILLKYRSTEGESKPTLEFTLSEYYKIVALTCQFPKTMKCVPGAATHVFIFHIFFHALILDIFRPFLANKDQRSFRSLSQNAPLPQAIFAASIRQLKQIILVYSNYPESARTVFWHVALMYVAPAVTKDRNDPEWRRYFFLCLHHYKILARSFGIVQWLVPGILSIAVHYGAISSSEANFIKKRFREDQRMRRPEGSGAGFVLDMDLAVTDWRAAQADNLVAEFEELALFNEFTVGIV